MDMQADQPIRVQRSFQELSEKPREAIEQALMARSGWSGVVGWNELLKSQRILIISEAGAGKTYECRAQKNSLWHQGEAAFYFDLAQLSGTNMRDLMLTEEEARFDAWLGSQSDIATIFLDSIDELKLTLGSFESALRRLNKALSGQLGRVKIVITTRPIPIDYHFIQQLLPIPEKREPTSSGAAFADIAFADIAMDRSRGSKQQPKDIIPAWRNVALLPLSDLQIRDIAKLQGVDDADSLLADIHRRNAEDFARRPQDLIELCSDWRDHRRIRTHREQVANNVLVKLKPRTDRREKLSDEKALDGASRLALAALLTRKLAIRHSAEADKGGEPGTALDPATILPEWQPDERRTLLERALFGFASYGRVRFHHRSVIEYLAARQLDCLLERGMSVRAVKRLLFAETPQGIKVVKPTMRPVAAWLALTRPTIMQELRDREPTILLDFGDPESLTLPERIRALRAYVSRYGRGEWRGMHVPRIQVHRFASEDLSEEVIALWKAGVENPEVRQLLLELIGAAPMPKAADIAHEIAIRPGADTTERIDALDALIRLNDLRLPAICESLASDHSIWPDRLTKNAVARLLPRHITVAQAGKTLARISESKRGGDLGWTLSRLITEEPMEADYLEGLRTELTNLVIDGLKWRSEWPHLVTSRQYLISPLATVCLRQLQQGATSDETVTSAGAALLLSDRHEYDPEGPIKSLRSLLAQATASVRRAAFWGAEALIQKVHPQDDPWKRLFEMEYQGPISLNAESDSEWVLAGLTDQTQSLADRSLMLEVAVRNLGYREQTWRDYVSSLKPRVADSPVLTARIDDCLKPPEVSKQLARMEADHKKRQEHNQRREAKAHASWVLFWREVANNPQTAFSPDRAGNTAWNLWEAMGRSGEESRASGWSRRFIELHFSKEVADRLRLTLKSIWRSDKPTLRSERPEGEKGTFLIRWQLGLAGIAAEAEDANWARRLSVEEAELAARYAPIELNGFPSWLDSLAAAHPSAVEGVIGPELTDELSEPATRQNGSMTLQNVDHATERVAALFLPRLRTWLDDYSKEPCDEDAQELAKPRLQRVVDILLKRGDAATADHIRAMATSQLALGLESRFSAIWLPTLMRLDPSSGTEVLVKGLSELEPAKLGAGATWIAMLFGDRSNEPLVDLSNPGFTPQILLRLVRLAYQHVRPADDVHHEGMYSSGPRDHAEQGRNVVLNAILNTRGPEGWAVKVEMANDPLFSHFRDRAMALATERAAEEADAATPMESDVAQLEKYRELSPMTRDEMFALLVDRLDDIDDLLLRDDSPREAWAGISEERVMRRELARELRTASNHAYTVDQEGATADEKETDIRMRSVVSNQQAVIELKLGDNRTGRDLRDTIKDQLVRKYMAAEVCKSGCLLVTINKTRTWQHPETGENLDPNGLLAMLQAEAKEVAADMGHSVLLAAKVLDLRPRLETETATAARTAVET